MKTQTVQAKHGEALIAPGEILRLMGTWTAAELIRLLWKVEFLEEGRDNERRSYRFHNRTSHRGANSRHDGNNDALL